MTVGKVYLIGAGPGDVGLFTIKGKDLLDRADVVVYDALVGEGILAMVPEGVKRINVGKRSCKHTMVQEDINKVLLDEALAGNMVVRLKGGDPFLFGRGGEELELLSAQNIPYEVVPGVTSSIAVPAYNGIPVTHRDFCSSVHIVTGHAKKGSKSNIDFEALVRTKGTLVFMMSISAMDAICSNLMTAGMKPEMPAAVLQQGTTANQKRIVSTVENLVADTEKYGIETPAIIVVGEVCALADSFGWYEKLPLAGYKVVVTRPRELVSTISEKLRIQGAEVLELPAISTKAIAENADLEVALGKLSVYDWVVFTSPTAVKVFFEALAAAGKDIRGLAAAKFAVVGEGTKKALKAYGIVADCMPTDVYDGEHLAHAIVEVGVDGKNVLIPRAKIGSPELVDILVSAGANVDNIPTYETTYVKDSIILENKDFSAGDVDCFAFTSSSSVHGFVQATTGLDYSKIKAACIGKQTEATAREYGMVTTMAEKATIDSLVQLIGEMKNGL